MSKSTNGFLAHQPTTPKKNKNLYNNNSKNHQDRKFIFNNEMIATLSSSNYNVNDLKINSLQEPTTPIDKLNTPRTVTVPHITFFPPSPTNHINENEISISGKYYF